MTTVDYYERMKDSHWDATFSSLANKLACRLINAFHSRTSLLGDSWSTVGLTRLELPQMRTIGSPNKVPSGARSLMKLLLTSLESADVDKPNDLDHLTFGLYKLPNETIITVSVCLKPVNSSTLVSLKRQISEYKFMSPLSPTFSAPQPYFNQLLFHHLTLNDPYTVRSDHLWLNAMVPSNFDPISTSIARHDHSPDIVSFSLPHSTINYQIVALPCKPVPNLFAEFHNFSQPIPRSTQPSSLIGQPRLTLPRFSPDMPLGLSSSLHSSLLAQTYLLLQHLTANAPSGLSFPWRAVSPTLGGRPQAQSLGVDQNHQPDTVSGHLDVLVTQDEAKTRFLCHRCDRHWTSMKGLITFVVILSHRPHSLLRLSHWVLKPGANVFFELFPQSCGICEDVCQPKWYPEEVQKVIRNLFVQIHGHFYRSVIAWEDQWDNRRRDGQPTAPHESSKCAACKQGLCCRSTSLSAKNQPPAGASTTESLAGITRPSSAVMPIAQEKQGTREPLHSVESLSEPSCKRRNIRLESIPC